MSAGAELVSVSETRALAIAAEGRTIAKRPRRRVNRQPGTRPSGPGCQVAARIVAMNAIYNATFAAITTDAGWTVTSLAIP
jgi:hypothetical protein